MHMAELNALDLIKDDHKRLKEIFKRAMNTDDAAARASLLDQIRAELIAHERMEEDIFYPALRAASEKAKDIVLEGYEEHHVIDVILDEMFTVPEEAEQWAAKLTVLHENLEHHIEEEEREMFKRARKSMSAEMLDELGHKMRQARQAASA
jgi:iron-sulfur cluster repair protein YtfE (RIC family)